MTRDEKRLPAAEFHIKELFDIIVSLPIGGR
jgi:hypothetical protein